MIERLLAGIEHAGEIVERGVGSEPRTVLCRAEIRL